VTFYLKLLCTITHSHDYWIITVVDKFPIPLKLHHTFLLDSRIPLKLCPIIYPMCYFHFVLDSVPENKNSPTITRVCCKKPLKWVATLPLGDINTEAWSSGMGVGRGANNPTL